MKLLQSKKVLLFFFLLLIIPLILFIVAMLSVTLNGTTQSPFSPTPTPVRDTSTSGYPAVRITTQYPPSDAKNADYTGSILLRFDQPVNSSDVSVSFSPSTQGSLKQIDQTTIAFKPTTALHPATKYTINVSVKKKTVIAIDNTKADTLTTTFKTAQSSGEEFMTQQEANNFQKVRQQADQAYQQRKQQFPFIIYLPYQTNHFTVSIDDNDVITIKTYGLTDAANTEYKKEALDWIRSNGGNPEALVIHYDIQRY